jgi:hypothetical protein
VSPDGFIFWLWLGFLCFVDLDTLYSGEQLRMMGLGIMISLSMWRLLEVSPATSRLLGLGELLAGVC